MTIRRRTDEVDDDGRRSVTVTDEPVTNTVAAADETVAEEQVVHSDGWNTARGFVRTFGLWILVALAAVDTLLGFRLGFLLAGANPTNGFVDFIYDVSKPLVDPFGGIAVNRAVDGAGVFESASLIAMIVYAVAALLLIAVLWAITAFPSPGGERSAVTRTRHQERSAHEH